MVTISLYLIAIVLANLSSTFFGPSASIANAFLFIGLDLTTRDKLHEEWKNRGLVWKMGLLIAVGSLLSYLINRNSAQIAIASTLAFAAAALTDGVVYHWLSDRTKMQKVNGSNAASALVDSVVFPTVAFGSLMPLIVIGQFAAKFFGGFLWSILLRYHKEEPTPILSQRRS